MAEVVLEGVSKSFPPAGSARKHGKQPVVAVRNLTLTAREEELLVLVGPSGCGKTTTLRLIAGLEMPDQGTIRLGGRVVNQVSPRERNIALVFQHYALYPHWTVYKNLAFGLELRLGGSWLERFWRRLTAPDQARRIADERSTIRNRVHQTARMLGIEDLLDRRPGQLSGGQRQRVALGRAVVREPAAFLLDEPLSNLDAQLRVEMRRELKELHGRLRSTMIYVTHDQVEALSLGDRIGVMDRGELHQIGPPQEVYDRPRNRFVAGFLGSPAMNFLEGGLFSSPTGIQFQCPGVAVPLEVAAHGEEGPSASPLPKDAGWFFPQATLAARRNQPVVLGVRPEDVLLREPCDGPSERNRPGLPIAAARARVSLVESLGDASLIHLEVECGEASPSLKVIGKTEARPAARPGQVGEVVFRPERIHLFDGNTGESLAK